VTNNFSLRVIYIYVEYWGLKFFSHVARADPSVDTVEPLGLAKGLEPPIGLTASHLSLDH